MGVLLLVRLRRGFGLVPDVQFVYKRGDFDRKLLRTILPFDRRRRGSAHFSPSANACGSTTASEPTCSGT